MSLPREKEIQLPLEPTDKADHEPVTERPAGRPKKDGLFIAMGMILLLVLLVYLNMG